MSKFILSNFLTDYWYISIIDENGKAYDDDLNAYIKLNGDFLYIPRKHWKHFLKLENINKKP